MSNFDNGLTDADEERLAVLVEECGEILHIVGKILRHGYDGYDPTVHKNDQITNRNALEDEIGDLDVAVLMLQDADNIDKDNINRRMNYKKVAVKRWLHHSNPDL